LLREKPLRVFSDGGKGGSPQRNPVLNSTVKKDSWKRITRPGKTTYGGEKGRKFSRESWPPGRQKEKKVADGITRIVWFGTSLKGQFRGILYRRCLKKERTAAAE